MRITRLSHVPTIRLIFWVVAVFLGICQTWFVRHTIFSDGISYIEIASAYLAGDFHNAINSYWSPLYSWLIALAFSIVHPAPYWQVATLHLVNFCAYVASLAAFEFFLGELVAFRSEGRAEDLGSRLPDWVLYVGGYCSIVFAGLSLIGIGYCSPDMIALGLTLASTGLLIRFSRTGGSLGTYILFGTLCALFFLARTAFAPVFLVCCVVVAVLLRERSFEWKRPLAAICTSFALLSLPFVIAISVKSGHVTIGEAGKLNYGWEIAGASRFAHWQGEPHDIGTPLHPTTVISQIPKAYVFTGQGVGTYSPWFNPAFWYDGIRPKIKIGYQLRVLFVNLSCLANLIVRSPVFLSALFLILIGGVGRWASRFVGYWPILLPSLAAILLYCVVYLEKRYVAGNFVVVWLTLLVSIYLPRERNYRWLPTAVALFCILYTGAFVVRRQTHAVQIIVNDLIHGQEEERSLNYAIAQNLKKLGMKKSDRVAVIGAAVDADWARLDGLKIVGEIPLTYNRNEKLFNNTLDLSPAEIKRFWHSDRLTQERILNSFREAGAKIVVADGRYAKREADRWPSLLDPKEPHMPKPDPETGEVIDFRYKILSGDKSDLRVLAAGSVRSPANTSAHLDIQD